MLTKEEKLAILSKAIDEGAQIDINFYDLPRVKANSLITDIAGEMNAPSQEHIRNDVYWYSTKENQARETFRVTAFYNPLLEEGYMVEDVKFEEVEMK